MMVHSYSSWSTGKAHEIKAQVDFNEKFFDVLFKNIYKGFLTDEEIVEVIGGRDLYFDQKEIYKRLKQRQDLRIKETKAATKKKEDAAKRRRSRRKS